jgi:ABC-type microcin C transport system duplicated ATPase subunit YejF
LLDVADLSIDYRVEGGSVRVLRGLGLKMSRGEVIGLLGHSGAGKTTLARALLRILPPEARLRSGRIWFRGVDLLALPEREIRAVRGRRIAMVFQEPASALNPLMKIGDQLGEAIRAHFRLDGRRAQLRAAEWLAAVGLDGVSDCLAAYPHQLSGGQRQRVLLAGALACEPDLLVCDEPTSSVDSLLRLRILECLASLRQRLSLSIILISHDLSILQFLSDQILELRDGRLVRGPAGTAPTDGERES